MEEYTLIVNGKKKPWPIENYMFKPVTIDFNWALDSTCYQAEVVTFTLREMLSAGVKVKNVRVDTVKKQVICTIPIVEKKKDYQLLPDMSSVKDQMFSELTFRVDGKEKDISNGLLHLSGKELAAKYEILYQGKQCPFQIENDVISVALPGYKPHPNSITDINPRSWIRILLPGFILSALICSVFCLIAIFLFNWTIIEESRLEWLENREQDWEEQKYLLNNYCWKKEDMISVSPRLGELYDALNTFEFDNATSIISAYNLEDISYIDKLNSFIQQPCSLEVFSEYEEYSRDGIITPNDYVDFLERKQKEYHEKKYKENNFSSEDPFSGTREHLGLSHDR